MTIIMETLPDRTATSTERSNNYIYFFLLLVMIEQIHLIEENMCYLVICKC